MKTIGIIGDVDTFRRNENYYDAATAVGFKTIPLIPGHYMMAPDPDLIDGLLIPGGGDINPERYAQRNTRSMEIDDKLDAFELSYLKEFVEGRKPIIGICRGHQLINVFFGGTLVQHLDNFERHVWIDANSDNVHGASVTDRSSFMYEIYGQDEISVNTAHHQAIDRLGDGLKIELVSDDGVIEAVRHESLPIIGVQFHPERMCLKNARSDTVNGLEIFEYFKGFFN